MRGAGPRHGAGWRPRPERGARPRPGTPGGGGGDSPGRLPGRGFRGVGPGSGHSVSPWQRREGRGGREGHGAGARQGPRMSRRRGAGAAAGGARLPGRGGAGSGVGAGTCGSEGHPFPVSMAPASPAGCPWNGSSQQRVPCEASSIPASSRPPGLAHGCSSTERFAARPLLEIARLYLSCQTN